MSDAVSTLYRLLQEQSSVVTYHRDVMQDQGNLWVVHALVTPPTMLNNNGTGAQSNIAFFSGTGRARRVKQAKQYAAQAVLSQLSHSGILPTNVRDRTQYILDRHNNQVVFKGQSRGENLPQRYRMELFVGGNTVPVAVSDWLIRRDAIKQVLQKACVELGYLSRSADDLKYNFIIEGTEENADEIRNSLGREDVGEFREGAPFTPGPLHMQRNTPSSATVVGERPSEDNEADFHRYLIDRFSQANFQIESWGTTLPFLWKYELFLNNSTTPFTVSEWLPPGLAKHSALSKAFTLLAGTPQIPVIKADELSKADGSGDESTDTESSSQSGDERPSLSQAHKHLGRT